MRVLAKLALVCACLAVFPAVADAQVTVIQNSGCTGSQDCGWSGNGAIGSTLKVGGIGCGSDQALVSLGIEINPPLPIPDGISCLRNCVLATTLTVNFPTDTIVFTIPMDRALIGQSFTVSCACVRATPFCVSFARALSVKVQ